MIRFLKIFFGTVFTLLILIGSCVFYAFKIEPYRIASNQLYLNEKTSDFIKVVQFAISGLKQTVLRSKTDAMRSERT